MQGQVEAALSQLLDMANEDPNNVPVLLALATGARGKGGGAGARHTARSLHIHLAPLSAQQAAYKF